MTELLDGLSSLGHKAGLLSDLIDLVSEDDLVWPVEVGHGALKGIELPLIASVPPALEVPQLNFPVTQTKLRSLHC